MSCGASDVVGLAASALTQAFKFLYDRVGAALDRRAATKKSEVAEATDVLASPLKPLQLVSEAFTPERLARLDEARDRMRRYLQDQAILPGDHDLVTLPTRVREDLEAIYGQRFTFVGESRPHAYVSVRQDHDEVVGAVTGIEATKISGTVNVNVEQSKIVHEGGEVTGLRIDGSL